MGITYIPGTVTGPNGQRTLDFLVDSGATYTLLPFDIGVAQKVIQIDPLPPRYAPGGSPPFQGGEKLVDLEQVCPPCKRGTAAPEGASPIGRSINRRRQGVIYATLLRKVQWS